MLQVCTHLYLSNTANVIVGFYWGTDNSIAVLQEVEPLLIDITFIFLSAITPFWGGGRGALEGGIILNVVDKFYLNFIFYSL